MDHVFKDIVNEQEEARRKAIENNLMAQARDIDSSNGETIRNLTTT